MGNWYKLFGLMILVVAFAVVLSIFVPVLVLLEIFLILLGAALLGKLGLIITRDIMTQKVLKRRNQLQLEIERLRLQRLKQQQISQDSRYGRVVRGRSFYPQNSRGRLY